MEFKNIAMLAAVVTALSGGVFAQALPTQKVLTADVAQTLVREAIASCRTAGFKVTVRVVDPSNVLKAFARDDGAAFATSQVAELKANSVVYFGRPSGPPPNLPAGAPVPPPFLPTMINAAGGVPIMAGDQMVGAIAVSGAPGGDKDAACANAALAKVADKLK